MGMRTLPTSTLSILSFKLGRPWVQSAYAASRAAPKGSRMEFLYLNICNKCRGLNRHYDEAYLLQYNLFVYKCFVFVTSLASLFLWDGILNESTVVVNNL